MEPFCKQGAQILQTNQLEAETRFSEEGMLLEKYNGGDNTTSKKVSGIWQPMTSQLILSSFQVVEKKLIFSSLVHFAIYN